MKTLLLLLILFPPGLKEDKVLVEREYVIENPKDMTIIIDNINGDVEVLPSGDNKVYLAVEIQISGHTDELVAQAKRELQLGEVLADDSLRFYSKAPFIRKNKWGYDMQDQPKYAFKYQYKVRVPKQVSVEAKTINNGNVLVQNVQGPVKACNVNGEVVVKNARIIKQASTVNGDITINFLESPKEPIDFNTVNGDFNFDLPKDFSARIYFDSMNGDLYTSFDYRKLKPEVTKSNEDGKFKIGSKSGIQIGSDGPRLSFNSINGNVYLNKSK